MPLWTLFQQQPLAQGIGLAAMLVGISAFRQRDDGRFRLRLCLYQAAIALHFFLMGAGTAALSAGLSCIRTTASGYTRSPWVMLLFLLLVWGLGIPGITGLALVTSLQSTDAGSGMTRLLRESGEITEKEKSIFAAFQFSSGASITNLPSA